MFRNLNSYISRVFQKISFRIECKLKINKIHLVLQFLTIKGFSDTPKYNYEEAL